MAKTSSLVVKLARDFPGIRFETADDFYWSPEKQAVYFVSDDSVAEQRTILHETAHGLLNHRVFQRDIDLVKMEREAWEYAQTTLAPVYGVRIDDDVIETMLDSYRDWLHARSTCPMCTMTGLQNGISTYHCLGCNYDWRVNDARRCGLKRYALSA